MSQGEGAGLTDAPELRDGEDWPLRPWLLAAIGALAGLLVHGLLDVTEMVAWRAGLAAFAFFTALAAGFTLRPVRLAETAIFALGLGAVMGGIAFLAANAYETRAATEYAFAAGVFFSLLAIPLFQAEFHRTRWATPYSLTHFHVWTDAVSAGGAALFMLLSWALLWLLHGLFSLVGIELIEDLIQTDWFAGLFMGATLGAALGVLRNQLGIIGTLQRVVMLVFALLAVPFALAILIFIVILLLSGGNALWEATDSATPVLLACAVFCFVLANAVVRDDDAARSSNIAMQAAALVLAACILPLTIFAAISMGIRIDQYGLAPERIWALIAIAIATAYGLAYWAALIRGRIAGWGDYLRRANLHLAVVSCGVALVLALPLLDFGAISTRDQLARLESGEVAPSEFDYAALRWDFGDAGREALAKLAEDDDPQIAEFARDAEQAQSRWLNSRTSGERASVADSVDLSAFDEATAAAIRTYIRDTIYLCDDDTDCSVRPLIETPQGQLVALFSNRPFAASPRFLLIKPGSASAEEQTIRLGEMTADGGYEEVGEPEGDEMELRRFEGQQLYRGGVPVSDPFIVPEVEPETQTDRGNEAVPKPPVTIGVRRDVTPSE